jgi:hypothetical protein
MAKYQFFGHGQIVGLRLDGCKKIGMPMAKYHFFGHGQIVGLCLDGCKIFGMPIASLANLVHFSCYCWPTHGQAKG